jgi:acetoin utilization deacetylase AcuC-like enzyme
MQAEHGVGRIAIVDFDVHHGNGTEAIFRGDDSVFYASLHQKGAYPGTGSETDNDATTLNVPLAAGDGDAEWLDAMDRIVAPALRRFDPELVLVSAGFDAHEEEDIYLIDTRVTDDGFRELARRCASLAPSVAAVLEGGYNLATLARLVEAALEGFSS